EGKAWWAHVQFLADDKLEGRNVGTPGYEKAVDYVESQFKAIGLKPAGTSGFRQPVKFDSRKLAADQSHLVLVRDGKEESLVVGQDGAPSARGELNGSKEASMVFIGYGLSIPDAGWDDLSGMDVRGKIAVYVNAFAPVKVSDNVKSHANTADERWAAVKRAGGIGMASIALPPAPPAGSAQGAAPGATPPGQGGGGGGGGPQPVITLSDRDVQNLSGQIVSLSFTARGAEKILAGTGHTLAEFAQLVKEGKPLPKFPVPGTLKMHAALTRDTFEAANVAALFEGSDPALKDEYVVMSSHLDHVGIGRAVNGDALYNGAMDDASGIAAMLQIAHMLKQSGAKTKRSILFVAVAAEEKGLLGSRYFAAHPTVPFDKIVGDINLDMFLPLYPLRVIEVQGFAESSLGEAVRVVARELGVEVQTDREPDQNRFIRSDQYSFIRRGVPALAFKFGYEFGTEDEKTRLAWVRDRYHQPSDDLDQPVDLEAAAKFNRVIMALLRRVADDAARPAWNADSFFKRFESR
ncbi:MAG: M20/M25/M40 family metallo-hydrolase, partial [Vicinamibacterales bacterium]